MLENDSNTLDSFRVANLRLMASLGQLQPLRHLAPTLPATVPATWVGKSVVGLIECSGGYSGF